jgi:hypothetical protein
MLLPFSPGCGEARVVEPVADLERADLERADRVPGCDEAFDEDREVAFPACAVCPSNSERASI